jgi:hypothetical protein
MIELSAYNSVVMCTKVELMVLFVIHLELNLRSCCSVTHWQVWCCPYMQVPDHKDGR